MCGRLGEGDAAISFIFAIKFCAFEINRFRSVAMNRVNAATNSRRSTPSTGTPRCAFRSRFTPCYAQPCTPVDVTENGRLYDHQRSRPS